MKTIKLSIVALLVVFAAACKKTNNTPGDSGNVSNSDAADLVASSLSENSDGVATVSNDATNVGTSLSLGSIGAAPQSRFNSDNATTVYSPGSSNKTLVCGTTVSDSISRQSGTGSSVTYSYNLDYNFTLNCINSVPNDLTSILTYSGSYSGPIWSSANTGSSNFTVTGLAAQAPDFIINGEYKRSGSFQSKADTTKHGTHSIDIVVTSLTLMKPARTIVSGTATITVTGNVPKKGNFSYSGTIVFNNDDTATLTLNGIAYTVNISTGIKIKKG
jgi:hypothetical protein